MSNPVLESFCCVLKRNVNLSQEAHVLDERPIAISYDFLCMFSAMAGVGGCLYQLYPRLPSSRIRHQPRKAAGYQRQNYVITWLAVADLLAALGILIRSLLWLSDVFPAHPTKQRVGTAWPDARHLTCAVLYNWINFFYMCTYCWSICYAVEIFLYVRGKASLPVLYQCLGWHLPLLMCVAGVVPLYYPSLVHCAWDLPHSVTHYVTSYLPLVASMIVNPVLFKLTADKIRSTLRALGRYTDQERKVVVGVQKKFFKIIIAFYVCWLPSVVNGCMHATGGFFSLEARACVWSMMAVLNPLQGFFNSLLFHELGGAYCLAKYRGQDKSSKNIFPPIEESQETTALLSFRRDEI